MEILRKYATATTVQVPIVKRGVVDFAVGADWTPAAGDVKVSIDGGAAANIGTLPSAVAMGNGAYWLFTLTGAEVTGKLITITVADSATKAVEDQAIAIATFGHASAQLPFDLGTASTPQTGDSFGRLGVPAGASIAADIAAVLVALGIVDDQVDDLETRLSAVRAGYLDNLSAGAVAQASTALSTAQWTNARATLLDRLQEVLTDHGAEYGNLGLADILRVLLSVAAGESTGAGTGTAKALSPGGGQEVVVASVDVAGNVTGVVLDP